MGATAQLTPTELAVRPGEVVTATLTVRNTGTVVDRFTFEALGAVAAWAVFSPGELSLFPEASATAQVTFAPPKGPSVPAGVVPFAVRVGSAEDPPGSVVEEGTLDVLPFSDVGAEMLPRIVSGRRAGMARLAVDNRSNVAYEAEVAGADPSAALALAFRPPAVSIPPGGAQFVRVRVRPRKTFWRGPGVTKPFRVTLTTRAAEGSPHPPEVNSDGSLLQEALLPRWVAAALGALVALAVLAVVLWFALLKPQIRDTASGEVARQLANAGVAPTTAGSGGGGGAPSGGGGGGGGGAGASAVTTPPVSATGPTTASGSGSVTVNGSQTANGNGTSVVYPVPLGHTLQVTDMLVQNAAGDSGTLALARNGTVLMQWSMANFRDLDYHWIQPTIFGPANRMQMIVSGCTNTCRPSVYFAGTLLSNP